MSSAAMLPLRDYQQAGINALVKDFREGYRRLAMVWPTGAGKTVGFAHLTKMVVEAGGRVLILAHRDELIEQAAAKLRAVAPGMRVGILKAERREILRRDVVVASVQSARTQRRLAELAAVGFSLVIVDEVHHVRAASYMAILEALGCLDDRSGMGALMVGFTATLERGDGLALGDVIQKVSHHVPIIDLIRQGYLLNPRGIRVQVEGLDLRGVRRSRGDFSEGDLGEAMMEALAPQAIARAYAEHAPNDQGIAFLPTVETAYATADELNAVGITAACVEGKMPTERRRQILRDSAAGKIQVVTNCMILTEGTDMPWVRVALMARPTMSAPLYVQMAGRVLRPYPGQEEALLLDVTGVGARHRLATLATLAGTAEIQERSEKLTPEELAALEELGLLALDEADMSGAGSSAIEGVDGRLVATEFELFERSHRTWLRTRAGHWFIEAGTGTAATVIFLVPRGEDRYSVAAVPTRAAGGRWVIEDVDMSYAMSWGEQAAEEIGGYIFRGAAWRKDRASDEQRDMLMRLDRGTWFALAANATRGEVSDLISIARASQRIDHLPMLKG